MASMTIKELVEDDGYSVEEAKREMDRRVFGTDVKYDRHGNPIEQGLGSSQHPTVQSMNVLLSTEGQDAYDRAIAEATKAGKWPPKPRPGVF